MCKSAQPPAFPANIALIGMMGSGKTTVGRLLAHRLGWRFVDTDEEIVTRSGRSIPEIFAGPGGEPEFRTLEADVVRDAVSRVQTVIATGGGAVLRDDSRAAIWGRCFVVWLCVTPEETAKRVSLSGRRPVLERYDDPVKAARVVLESRSCFYSRAHHIEETTGRDAEDIAAGIVSAWKSLQSTG